MLGSDEKARCLLHSWLVAAGDVAMRRAVTFAAGRPRIGVDRYLEARNAAEQVGDSVVVPRRRRVRALPALDV